MHPEETEYQAINAWRNSKVQQHDTASSILFPLAALIFFTSFQANCKDLPIAAFYFTFVVVIIWQIWGRYHNFTIVKTYPKIVELEKQLGYTFTRQYLKERWGLRHLPRRNDVTNRTRLCPLQLIPPFYYYYRFKDLGHLCWNLLALLFILATTLVITKYLNCNKDLVNSWYNDPSNIRVVYILLIIIIIIDVSCFLLSSKVNESG